MVMSLPINSLLSNLTHRIIQKPSQTAESNWQRPDPKGGITINISARASERPVSVCICLLVHRRCTRNAGEISTAWLDKNQIYVLHTYNRCGRRKVLERKRAKGNHSSLNLFIWVHLHSDLLSIYRSRSG